MPGQGEEGIRRALIVATSEYGDPTLRQLRAPGHDGRDLADVLGSPAIGGFDVQTLINVPSGGLLRGFAQFCQQAGPGDLLLIYLSCHGVLDIRGRLHYATVDTDHTILGATAVAAHWLSEQLDDCRARQQVTLLDCCHSGAFARGSKGNAAPDLKGTFGGRGKIVLTASRATEYSFEDTTVIGEGVRSVFTRAIVDGLRTGEADRDEDGLVTVNDLYRHVYDTVRSVEPRQTPELWTFGAEGDLVVARSPRGPVVRPALLPEDLSRALENPSTVIRESGVKVLADLLDHGKPGIALTARLRLQRIIEEDHPRLAALARAAHEADQGQAVTQLEALLAALEEARREAEKALTAPEKLASPQPAERPEGARATARSSGDHHVIPSRPRSTPAPRVTFSWRGRPRLVAAAIAVVAAVASLTISLLVIVPGGGAVQPGGDTPAAAAVAPGFQGVNPGTGSPTYGGTLNMTGVGDVQYMDYDVSFYTTDSEVQRLTVRQLYSWPAIPGKTITPEPDLALDPPVVSNGGRTVKVTIRNGVMWNTSPAREVLAADVVRGIKRACNPSPAHFGDMEDFDATIVGLAQFCQGYPATAQASAAALKAYVEGHSISGITTSGGTITFQLTKPATWLEGAMTLSPFSAVPIEAENALPATIGVYRHMYSDGPYEITSYAPKKEIKFARNPAWKASTDPLRKAYVNAINVDETGNQTTIYQEMGTNSPSLGMSFDALVPISDPEKLLAELKSGNTDVNLGQTYTSNPYLDFNTVSPNNAGALGNVSVRQALSFALDRSRLIDQIGGPDINIPLTHVLPSGTDGAQNMPASYNPYPYDPAKARQMLAAAGFTSQHKLVIKFLYISDSTGSTKIFRGVQSQLNALGDVTVTGVPVVFSNFYSKYLQASNSSFSPSPAYLGSWDMTEVGWAPDWYGDSAVSWFKPLFSTPEGDPASGGGDYGYYRSATVNADVSAALDQITEARADVYWAKADEAVMADAAIYPITEPEQLAEHASYVHNAVYMTQWQNFDPANVWLSTP
jgi:peptide/nickel transport system substrate-binding protein